MDQKERIIEAFRRNGFRATPQRIAVAQAVLGSKDHPTAEQVFNRVKETVPTISLSTVYNTLHTMRNLKMLQELAFNHNHRFDPNTSIHINMVCENCGEITDIKIDNIEKEIFEIAKRRGFKITRHRFDLYGICRKCEC